MNLNNWYEEKNVSLLGDTKAMMESDWETFKNKVLLTPDLYGFIDSCNQADLQKATKALSQNLCAKLVKYKPSSRAMSLLPITATSIPLKKLPSQVAQ